MVSTTLYLWDCYGQRYSYPNFKISLELWEFGSWPPEMQTIYNMPANIVKILVVLD